MSQSIHFVFYSQNKVLLEYIVKHKINKLKQQNQWINFELYHDDYEHARYDRSARAYIMFAGCFVFTGYYNMENIEKGILPAINFILKEFTHYNVNVAYFFTDTDSNNIPTVINSDKTYKIIKMKYFLYQVTESCNGTYFFSNIHDMRDKIQNLDDFMLDTIDKDFNLYAKVFNSRHSNMKIGQAIQYQKEIEVI